MAASRKNDPFNFDDIYKQAGVEDLFVKKTLGELKQKQSPGPGPVAGAASTARAPATASSSHAAAPAAASFDLDFLSSIATPGGGGTPTNLSKPSSSANLQQHAQAATPPKPVQHAASALDDPFALFNEVPGAAPAQRHTPPAPPAAPTTGGFGNLLDFEDNHVAAPVPAPVTHAPAPAPAPAPPPAPPAPAPAAMVAPRSPPPPAYDEHTAYSPVAGTSAAAAAGGGDRSYGRGNPGSSQSYSQAPQLQQAPPPEARFHSTTAAPGAGPPPPSFSHQHSGHSQFDDAHSQASASSMSAPYAWNHASHGSASSGAGGISGYLKAFTKKAVRVAKAGLAQLEHALEGLDQGAAGGGGGAGEQYGGGAYSATSDRGAEGGQISNDEALAWAVRLADMAPHAQQQELAQMPPPLRRRVIEVLREQIRSEHEAVRSGSATSSHEAHDTYVPPGAGHGHGAPMAPPMPYRGSSDGAYQAPHIGAPAAAAPAPPPAVAAPAQAQAPPPPAPVAPPPPPAPAHHESHDLLGMGSGGLSPMGSAATPAAAAARATYPAVPAASAPPPTQPPVHVPVPAPAPAVEDLLGFDDGPSSSAAPRPAASTSAPTAAAAQPPPPPPPQQPAQAPVAAAAAVAAAASAAAAAAVHVDDMDDFFSGGRPAASSRGAATPPPPAAAAAAAAAAARAGSVHASASAPHLVAGRSAGVSGSNSAAALFDMLHDEEAVGVDVGSVDVSEYADLYKGEQGHADEPEIRKRLRAQREKAKHDQMKAALKAKLEMEAEEAARREQQVELKEQYKANIETWKNRNKGNIRGLLGSLQTVLWPDSGWTPVSVGDMLEPLQVKKVWMRANLLVHPDKVRQRNGTAEQVAIADMVFDVLKDTYNSFR